MSNGWDIYSLYIGQNGYTQRERIINETKDMYLNKIQESPSYHEVEIDGNIVNLQINSAKTTNKKTFVVMPGETVALGQVVTWNNMHWLITEVDFDDTLYLKGTMEQCNRKIRWQNQETKEIVERWCVASKPYYSNLAEDKTVTVSTREFKIMVTYDAETILVDLDRRLLLEKINNHAKAYKVTSVDSITNRYEDLEATGSGFIVWNVTQDQFNPDTDNDKLMIADYINDGKLGSINENQNTIKKCVIKGINYIKAGIGNREYVCECYENENLIDNVDIEWNIECEKEEYIKHIHADVENNILKIFVSNVEDIINSKITLKATSVSGDFIGDEFIIDVRGIYE